jgi:hypothetical protein
MAHAACRLTCYYRTVIILIHRISSIQNGMDPNDSNLFILLTHVICVIPVGVRFFAHAQAGPGAHSASCTMGTGSVQGVKLSGRGADHPPPPSAQVTTGSSYTTNPPLGQFRPVTGLLYLIRSCVFLKILKLNNSYFHEL